MSFFAYLFGRITRRTLKTNLAGVLKQGNKGASAAGRHRTHNLLVISEIAMALIPLIGAGLLLRSFQHLLEVDPGFRMDHILTMEIEQPALSFVQINQLSQDEQINWARNSRSNSNKLPRKSARCRA
jgi:putative ABC transport system permease protein